jgi:hypothetical protein
MFVYDNVFTGAFLPLDDASFYQIIGWSYIALIMCLLLIPFLRHKKLISEKYVEIAEICIHGFAYFGVAITYFDYGGDKYMNKKYETTRKNKQRY